ncbi:MAG: hypothetical protein CM15mP78_08830 [Candidatus Poseidoniales archaeon]|nr:MAG: hypothetical protein CM15mP78_08830 [Candidatus Poseidoniales archaeon]
MSRLVDLRALYVVHRIARTGEQHHGRVCKETATKGKASRCPSAQNTHPGDGGARQTRFWAQRREGRPSPPPCWSEGPEFFIAWAPSGRHGPHANTHAENHRCGAFIGDLENGFSLRALAELFMVAPRNRVNGRRRGVGLAHFSEEDPVRALRATHQAPPRTMRRRRTACSTKGEREQERPRRRPRAATDLSSVGGRRRAGASLVWLLVPRPACGVRWSWTPSLQSEDFGRGFVLPWYRFHGGGISSDKGRVGNWQKVKSPVHRFSLFILT